MVKVVFFPPRHGAKPFFARKGLALFLRKSIPSVRQVRVLPQTHPLALTLYHMKTDSTASSSVTPTPPAAGEAAHKAASDLHADRIGLEEYRERVRDIAEEAAHTPTPWFIDGRSIRGNAQHPHGNFLVCQFPYQGMGRFEQDAAFIIRACNSHAALVAALENALERTSNIEWQAQYRHALNAAKGA